VSTTQKQVPLRVFEDDEVLVRPGGPGVAGRSDGEQPLHLPLLVVGVEVEVQPVLAGTWLRDLLEGHVHLGPAGVPEDDPAVLGGFPRDVPEGLLPERRHRVEIAAVDHDRADPHCATLSLRTPPAATGS
jgi:hypothetical protein